MGPRLCRLLLTLYSLGQLIQREHPAHQHILERNMRKAISNGRNTKITRSYECRSGEERADEPTKKCVLPNPYPSSGSGFKGLFHNTCNYGIAAGSTVCKEMSINMNMSETLLGDSPWKWSMRRFWYSARMGSYIDPLGRVCHGLDNLLWTFPDSTYR